MKRTAWSLVLVGSVLVPTVAWAGAAIMGSSRFEYDLCSGSGDGPNKNFLSIRGGAPRFTMIDYRTGQDRDNKKTTGDVEYDDVEFVCPMVKGQAGNMEDIKTIVNTWSDGTNAPWNSTLVVQDRNGNEVETFDYLNNVPVCFTLPSVDSGQTGILKFNIIYKPRTVETTKRKSPGGIVKKALGARGARVPNVTRIAATNGRFLFELDGEDAGATTVVPGPVEFTSEEVVGIPDGPAQPSTTGAFGDWVVERAANGPGPAWKPLFEQLRAGVNPDDGSFAPDSFLPARLTYLNRAKQPVATVNLEVLVTGYEPAAVTVDKRRRQVGRERLTLTICSLSVE